MKPILFLITLVGAIFLTNTSTSPTPPAVPTLHPLTITSEKTTFSTPQQWVINENNLLKNTEKRQYPNQKIDLTIKVTKSTQLSGITFLTLSVPHDTNGDNGSTVYINGSLTIFIVNGNIYFISAD